jgi:hypothetical protein
MACFDFSDFVSVVQTGKFSTRRIDIKTTSSSIPLITHCVCGLWYEVSNIPSKFKGATDQRKLQRTQPEVWRYSHITQLTKLYITHFPGKNKKQTLLGI